MQAKVKLGVRLLLGAIFFIFGLNGFLQFIPAPPMPDQAMAFMGGLAGSGYFFPVLKITEILVGLALLSGMYVPLALVILAPISIQIFLFHFFLTPGAQNWILPIVILALHITLARQYWDRYRPLLQKN